MRIANEARLCASFWSCRSPGSANNVNTWWHLGPAHCKRICHACKSGTVWIASQDLCLQQFLSISNPIQRLPCTLLIGKPWHPHRVRMVATSPADHSCPGEAPRLFFTTDFGWLLETTWSSSGDTPTALPDFFHHRLRLPKTSAGHQLSHSKTPNCHAVVGWPWNFTMPWKSSVPWSSRVPGSTVDGHTLGKSTMGLQGRAQPCLCEGLQPLREETRVQRRQDKEPSRFGEPLGTPQRRGGRDDLPCCLGRFTNKPSRVHAAQSSSQERCTSRHE